jgi:hypothetical protein
LLPAATTRWIAIWSCCYACASTITEQPGPRGLRADQHLAIATREDDRAAQIAHWPERMGSPDRDHPADQLLVGTWFGTWNTVGPPDNLLSAMRCHRAWITVADTRLISELQRRAARELEATTRRRSDRL